MKTEQNCMDYEAPQVEIVEVEVEKYDGNDRK